MEKNKEDGMTDLEIIKKNFNIITDSESAGYDYWYELEKEALDAATRMAAEIERLKKNVEFIYINETEKQFVETLSDNDKKELIENLLCANLTKALANEKLRNEKALLQIALAEKPDVVFCKDCIIFKNCFIQKGYKLEFCSFGRKEAKDED